MQLQFSIETRTSKNTKIVSKITLCPCLNKFIARKKGNETPRRLYRMNYNNI